MRLPARIRIVEVGPRDGLQSLGTMVSADAKVRMIDRLSDAGLTTIEVTGFASPRAIPQFADAEEVCRRIVRRPGTVYRAMVPNARGARRAACCNVDEMVGLLTMSRAYMARNQNMTMDQAIDEAIAAFAIAEAAEVDFTMAIGLAFWCAYEGRIDEADVVRVTRRLRDAGIRRFYLAATVGLEDPVHVSGLFDRVLGAVPDATLGFHVHNLAGRATALTLAALDAGAQWVEGAICGIGGGIAMPPGMACTGNLATEDLVTFLADAGVETGLSSGAIIAAATDCAEILGIAPRSHAANGASRDAVAALVRA